MTAAILVVGDVMLDHFLVGHADRISPEAPVPIVRLEREEYRLGGAANVAANVRSLGAEPFLVGLTGRDAAAERLTTALKEHAVPAVLVADPSRPTTEKLRAVTTRHQQVARVDRESSSPVTGDPLDAIVAAIANVNACRAVVISDYAKGTITPPVVTAAVSLARRQGCPILVDPKVPDPAFYRGASVITPNHREAEAMTSLRITDHGSAARAAEIISFASGASVVITWGEHGMFVYDISGQTVKDALIPVAGREVSDVTGAGDTVIAALAVAIARGASLADAAAYANQAAGVAVSKFGPVAVSANELK